MTRARLPKTWEIRTSMGCTGIPSVALDYYAVRTRMKYKGERQELRATHSKPTMSVFTWKNLSLTVVLITLLSAMFAQTADGPGRAHYFCAAEQGIR